jgi:hypothetical protein
LDEGWVDATPHRILWATVIAMAGDHARAAAEADVMVNGQPAGVKGSAGEADKNGDNLYGLAGVYSAAAEAASRDGRLRDPERAGVVEKYAGQAVSVLKRLVGVGYFRDDGRREMLVKTDEQLRLLRLREDFRQLVRGLENRK